MKILFDTNVIVDVLQQRQPWFAKASELVMAVAEEKITGCLTAKQITDLYYFSRRQFSGQPDAELKARAIIEKLLSLFELIDTQASDCLNALAINNGDYEDAVLISAARRTAVDYIVTRNQKNFPDSGVRISDPDNLFQLLKESQQKPLLPDSN
ncbi:MAG: PIN domain-containing protein [Erysipelotrichaceae bacterium]|nr:PIN domain-containing protein [Erysipelotrichaceae bacterium]